MRNRHLRLFVILGLAVILGTVLGSCSSDSSLPDSLYGRWRGHNISVSTLEFSEGGRIEINGGQCAGSYDLRAMDETKAILDTDYIKCSLLDGTIVGADITVSNDSLRIDGDVIGGNYVRATATGDQPAAQASSNTTSNAPEAHATAEISFRPVLDIVPQSPLLTDPGADHPDNLDPVTGLSLPDDVNAPIAYLASDDGNTVYVVGPAFVAGDDMKGGHAQFNNAGGGTGAWFVIPEFTAEGGERFRRGTGELATYPVGTPERHLAIVVDGVVTSAPEIAAVVSPETGIDPNDVVITIGTTNDSQAEAERLAAALQQ